LLDAGNGSKLMLVEPEHVLTDVSDCVHALSMHERIFVASAIMLKRILQYSSAHIASPLMNTAKMTAEILAAGWTQTEIANYCGVVQSTVARWVKGKDPEGPTRDKLAELYAHVIGGGRPHKADLEVVSIEDVDSNGVGFVDGKVTFKGRLPGSTPETATIAGLGAGKIDGAVASVQTKGIATGHAVAAEWVIPPAFLRHGLGGHPETTIIIPVIGHSMEPRLFEGDRVIVDVSQNVWVADAMYAIAFDDDNFQVKTLKVDRSLKARTYRIISEASPQDEERAAEDDFRIVGRVVGRISRP
jgi:hypothetical protein